MIRVLIVEDEPPIQRRTKRMIERIDADFTVAATAGDGEEALEIMRDEHFDVLFTDIRMPVMDGMQLMKKVQQLYPNCSIVVLSGYQDFEYVSSAVRAQAMDYLLKPIAADTLEKLLFKLKESFVARKQEHIHNSVAARIHQILPESAPGELQAVRLGICLFCAGALPQRMDADPFDHVPQVWQRLSLIASAKALRKHREIFLEEFIGDTPALRILVYQQADGEDGGWIKQLYEEIAEQSELPVSCICLSDTTTVSEIGTVQKKLHRLLSERIVIGKGFFDTVDAKTLAALKYARNDFADDADSAAKYAEIVSAGNPKASAAHRLMLLDRLRDEGWTQQRVLRFFQRVVTLVNAKSTDLQVPHLNAEWLYTAVSTAVSMEELAEMTEALDGAAPGADGEGNETMARVREYLNANYAGHITGQTLAKHFGYVPSYISFLFRQTYGQSPAEYLTQLRIEKAKELMLGKPDMLIREVAELVGFKNQYHFSRVFKKNEGLWPSEYKP